MSDSGASARDRLPYRKMAAMSCVVAFLVSACGQKGALYLPAPPSIKVTTPKIATPAPGLPRLDDSEAVTKGAEIESVDNPELATEPVKP